MSSGRGASLGDYGAPLFAAWQLTNRCAGSCLHCCEESGPDKAWPGELDREQALRVSRELAEAGIPYAAFGGGEPLAVPHAWEVFETLCKGGVELKLETDGLRIGEAEADRIAAMDVQCVQISVDGASARTHRRVRPGGDFHGAVKAIERLVRRGQRPEFVFVPTRLNLHEAPAAYDLAAELGCRAFVTGPLMRLGRAWQNWETLAPTAEEWRDAATAIKQRQSLRGNSVPARFYPWDILMELAVRLESPQAMILIVPDGKVKLLNALPFAPSDLRRDGVLEAWRLIREAWASAEVRLFIEACREDPSLLRHANETWPPGQFDRLSRPQDRWSPQTTS